MRTFLQLTAKISDDDDDDAYDDNDGGGCLLLVHGYSITGYLGLRAGIAACPIPTVVLL